MTDTKRGSEARQIVAVLFHEEGVVAPERPVPIIETLKDPRSPVGEELRLLRANLQAIRQKRPQKRHLGCLAVVSALPGEGKSTVSLGLATALAREPGHRILLVESDLRRPGIAHQLGLSPHPGLGEWLNEGLEPVPVRFVDPGGFFLLSSGATPLERSEDVGSARMDALLRAARERFDLVILDATPILPVADVILLQELVDGFLLVVRSRMTPRAAIHDALGRIRAEKVIGVVLNDHREYRSSYMAYAYHGYGMRAGSGTRSVGVSAPPSAQTEGDGEEPGR
jgi:succinoglycan biosynthesis transport protein ExoP